ncbi:glycosyltransferase family 2 protein [Microcella sp.]|uniref:glycosyltransferase family 2 protein n=1 Tax=Microcella sp. TaxID=1913979 RepID=UPI002563D899|nr:glycosyltransferase [Microcella sp.]MBX9472896.1 glycosyltransferase [Microcella sp.]
MIPRATTVSGPYAPIPSTFARTSIRAGSWFQVRPRRARTLAAIAVLVGASYLIWRVVATSTGVNPWLFWPLFAAELFGYLSFVIMVIETWSLPPTPRPPALDLAVDIVIVTYDEDVDVVEPTVIGALAVRGRTSLYLCDDGRRPEMRALAEHYGVTYVTRSDNAHAKAGNINAVLPRLTGDLLLVLDADHVAAPDLLEAMTGYFDDDQVALVQSAHSFRNHNSVMHHESGRHEQSLFFDVLLPGRNRLGSVFWCGSAAVIRLSALRDVGGIATVTSTEDFETSLLLQRAGYRIRYHNEHLIQGLAPDNLASYTVQRARWAEGTLSAFHWRLRMPFGRGLRFSQQVSYVGTLLHYLTPVQRLVFAGYVVAVGVFALIPVAMPGPAGVAFWAFWMLISAFSATALHRGVSGRVEGIRTLHLTFEAHLRALPALVTRRPMRFHVTPKNEPDLGGWASVRFVRLPIVMAGALAAVLLARAADTVMRSLGADAALPPLELGAFAVISFFSVLDITVALQLAVRAHRRRQYRRLWRFPVVLSARTASTTVQCVDLHQSGAALVVPRDLVELASTLPFSVKCRTLGGSIEAATGVLTITSRSAIGPSGAMTRVGGSVRWNDSASRTRVITHCYVVEPYRARNRAWTRAAARVPVMITASLGETTSTCVDVSIGGAAFITTEPAWNLHDRLPVELQLSSGERVTGEFRVRNIVPSNAGLTRIGGTAEWHQTAWLARYGAVVHTPSRPARRQRSAQLTSP